jgi:hypothetical protein
MRTWASALAILACLVCAEPAMADSPAEVYSDFAEDLVLNCGHSRSALKGALNDASLHQYGDPLTFIQVKLAIRKQLAGSCRRRTASRPRGGTSPTPGEPGPEAPGSTQSTGPKSKQQQRQRSENEKPGNQATAQGSKDASDDRRQSGGMVLLGVGLLLLTLASGGWAARRAFDDRE